MMDHLPALAPPLAHHEEAFLRRYTESLTRLIAMVESGAAYALGLTPDQTDELERAAAGILRKAEQLNLSELASATGMDRVYFLTQLKRICDDPQGHIAIKGLNLRDCSGATEFGMAPEGHVSYSAGLHMRARRTPLCSVRGCIDPIPPQG
jgi:hypothetical protein